MIIDQFIGEYQAEQERQRRREKDLWRVVHEWEWAADMMCSGGCPDIALETVDRLRTHAKAIRTILEQTMTPETQEPVPHIGTPR